MEITVGIIGGSGLDNPNLLDYPAEVESCFDNKYGKSSSSLLCGKLGGVDVVIISRHGRNHELSPTQVNYRANINSLKQMGCTHILATTAVGSLREYIHRGCLVFPDQFIDFTKFRNLSMFTEEVRHTPMADPFDKNLREALVASCWELELEYFTPATVITIEGPRFSTRAESNLFRSWGADIINMSTCPEVILANELGIPYQTIAMATDYDCWKTDEPPVDFGSIKKVMAANTDNVIQLIKKTLPKIKENK